MRQKVLLLRNIMISSLKAKAFMWPFNKPKMFPWWSEIYKQWRWVRWWWMGWDELTLLSRRPLTSLVFFDPKKTSRRWSSPLRSLPVSSSGSHRLMIMIVPGTTQMPIAQVDSVVCKLQIAIQKLLLRVYVRSHQRLCFIRSGGWLEGRVADKTTGSSII